MEQCLDKLLVVTITSIIKFIDEEEHYLHLISPLRCDVNSGKVFLIEVTFD